MSYTKLFSHIITSSIWSEDDQTRILWITFLALSDKHGEVMASIPGLANVSNLSIESVKRGIEKLSSPDEYSRTPDEEGRRIVQIPGGWSVVNYAKHRRMASIDEQREKTAARVQRFRERRLQEETRENVTLSVTQPNGFVTHSNGCVTHQIDNAEAEAEYRVQTVPNEIEGSKGERVKRCRFAPGPSDDFLKFWNEYPRRVAMKAAWKSWEKVNPPLPEVLESLTKYKKTEQWRRGKEYIPHASTWLNQERWDDEV